MIRDPNANLRLAAQPIAVTRLWEASAGSAQRQADGEATSSGVFWPEMAGRSFAFVAFVFFAVFVFFVAFVFQKLNCPPNFSNRAGRIAPGLSHAAPFVP